MKTVVIQFSLDLWSTKIALKEHVSTGCFTKWFPVSKHPVEDD